MMILFCNSDAGKKIFSFIGQIFDIIMIVIPIILILMGTIDFIKAVISHKDDEMKKSQNAFIKRIIIGVAIFFVPVLVNFLIGLVFEDINNPCMKCFLAKENCKTTKNNMSLIKVESLELHNSECKDKIDKDLCCKEKNGPNDADGIWVWNDNFGCQNTTLNTN